MELHDEFTIVERVYLSISHIVAAAHFARTSAALESDESKIFVGPGQFSEDWHHEHRAHVIASILSTIAFLEATINELFADACQELTELQPALDSESLRSLAKAWKEGGRRFPTLEKYQLALDTMRREKFSAGKAPFQLLNNITDRGML